MSNNIGPNLKLWLKRAKIVIASKPGLPGDVRPSRRQGYGGQANLGLKYFFEESYDSIVKFILLDHHAHFVGPNFAKATMGLRREDDP